MRPPPALKKAPALRAACEQPLPSQGWGGTICKVAQETSPEFSSKCAPVTDYAIVHSKLSKKSHCLKIAPANCLILGDKWISLDKAACAATARWEQAGPAEISPE